MPFVIEVVPAHGDRGDRFTAIISGDDLTGVDTVEFGAGIGVSRLVVTNDGILEIKLDIDEDANPGMRNVRASRAGVAGNLTNGFEVLK